MTEVLSEEFKGIRRDVTRHIESKFYEIRSEIDALRKEIEGLRLSLGDTEVNLACFCGSD